MSSIADRGRFGSILLLLACTLLGSAAQADRPDRLRELSNQEIVAATGRSVTEWGNSWWQWAFKHPEILGDTSGEFADLGDVRGPVFFAEASGLDPFVGSADVPRGEYVLLPVATYIWTFFDPCAEARCARRIVNENFIKGIKSVFVWLDGRPVGNWASHVVKVDRNPNDFLVDAGPIQEDGYGGILPALQGGYWLMLDRLPPGRHSVVMRAQVSSLDPLTGEPTGEVVTLETHLTLRSIECRHHRYCHR
jgi:hypothetical protein